MLSSLPSTLAFSSRSRTFPLNQRSTGVGAFSEAVKTSHNAIRDAASRGVFALQRCDRTRDHAAPITALRHARGSAACDRSAVGARYALRVYHSPAHECCFRPPTRMLPLLVWTALLLALSQATAVSNSYRHDGSTTYCWVIPQPSNQTLLTEADRVDAAAECPLSVSMSVASATVTVSEALNVSWTVVANRTLAVGADDNSTDADWSGQILQANVQSCVFGTECDPFDSGDGFVAHTGSVLANVTEGQTTFRATLSFPEAGEYSVLAHVVVAVENSSRRVDYGVFTRVKVLPAQVDQTTAGNSSTTELTRAPSPTATGTSILLSKGTIIGLLAGVSVALLLSVIAIFRTRRAYLDTDPRVFHQCQPTPAASNLRVDAGRTSQTSTLPPTSPAGPRPRPRPRKQRSSTQALPSKTDTAPSVAAVPGASPVDDRYAVSQRGTAQWQDFVVPPRRSHAPHLQRAESDLEL